MAFQSEQEDETHTGNGEETGVSRKPETKDKSGAAKNANETNTETDKNECKVEGPEERLAKLPSQPAKLSYEITPTVKRLVIRMEGPAEGMAEVLKAAATIPGVVVTVVEAAPCTPPVSDLQEVAEVDHVQLSDGNSFEGQCETIYEALGKEQSREMVEC
jgi:hypothetical protein